MNVPISSDAVANNHKVLDSYAQKLASDDLQVYTRFTHRLGVWLKSDKAYYLSARPKILELLEIAYATLHRQLNLVRTFPVAVIASSPWVGPYARLIQQVLPHKARFIEPGSQDRLKVLASGIEKPTLSNITTTAKQAVPSGVMYAPAPLSSVSQPPLHPHTIRVPDTMGASASSLISALGTMSQMALPNAAQRVALPSVVSRDPSNSSLSSHSPPAQPRHQQLLPPPLQIQPHASSIITTGLTSQSRIPQITSPDPLLIGPFASSATNPPSITHTQPSETQPSTSSSSNTPKPKSKKKRKSTGAFAEFLMADLEWYKTREKDKMNAAEPSALRDDQSPVQEMKVTNAQSDVATQQDIDRSSPAELEKEKSTTPLRDSATAPMENAIELTETSNVSRESQHIETKSVESHPLSVAAMDMDVESSKDSIQPLQESNTDVITAIEVGEPASTKEDEPVMPDHHEPGPPRPDQTNDSETFEPRPEAVATRSRSTSPIDKVLPSHDDEQRVEDPGTMRLSADSTTVQNYEEKKVAGPQSTHSPSTTVVDVTDSPTEVSLPDPQGLAKTHRDSSTEDGQHVLDRTSPETVAIVQLAVPEPETSQIQASTPGSAAEHDVQPVKSLQDEPRDAFDEPTSFESAMSIDIREQDVPGDAVPATESSPVPMDHSDSDISNVHDVTTRVTDIPNAHVLPADVDRQDHEDTPIPPASQTSEPLPSTSDGQPMEGIELRTRGNQDVVMVAVDVVEAAETVGDGAEIPQEESSTAIEALRSDAEIDLQGVKESRVDTPGTESEGKQIVKAEDVPLLNSPSAQRQSIHDTQDVLMEIDEPSEITIADSPEREAKSLSNSENEQMPTVGHRSESSPEKDTTIPSAVHEEQQLPLAEVRNSPTTNGVNGHKRAEKVFGPEMVAIAIQRGSSGQETISIDFNIDPDQFTLVSKWNNRNETTEDVSDALCLSLACYSCADIHTMLENTSEFPPIGELIAHGSSWPNIRGGIGMNVRYKEGRNTFPISPPYVVTPDNMIDVTEFLELGTNCVHIRQYCDARQWIFVLHAHFPTAKQLNEVAKKRRDDAEWDEWVRKMAMPFNTHLPPRDSDVDVSAAR